MVKDKKIIAICGIKRDSGLQQRISFQRCKRNFKTIRKNQNLWPTKSNLSGKGFTNATPAVWALPNYFEKIVFFWNILQLNYKKQ